jgi:hypothetical protein
MHNRRFFLAQQPHEPPEKRQDIPTARFVQVDHRHAGLTQIRFKCAAAIKCRHAHPMARGVHGPGQQSQLSLGAAYAQGTDQKQHIQWRAHCSPVICQACT